MSNTWQLGALMKKNWILMKRSCCTTCCEILFPIILMILMVLVRRAIKVETYIEPTDMDSFLQSNSTALLDPSTLMEMKGQNKSNWNGLTIRSALSICGSRRTIAAVGDETELQEIKYKIAQLMTIQGRTANFKSFKSVNEMNQYVKDPGYGADPDKPSLCFGFFYKQVDTKTFNYSLHYFDSIIRGGIQDTPNTLTPSLDPFQKGPDMGSYRRWLNSGYLEMMQIINQIILQKSTNNKNASLKFGVMSQKYQAYTNDPFGNFIGFMLPFFLIIAYLSPLCVLVFRMVQDKETRAKEGMKIMGLKESIYFLSYFLHWLIQNIFYSIIISLLLTRVLTTVGLLYIFGFIFLFGMCIFALAYFFQALMDKIRIAIIITILVYFIMYFVSVAVLSEDIQNIAKMLISLLPPTCLQLGISVLGKFVSNNITFNSSNVSYSFNNFSVANMYTMLIIDFFIYLFLGFYFENVINHEYGPKRGYFFLCSRSYWCKQKRVMSTLVEEKPKQEEVIQIGQSRDEANFQSEQNYEERQKKGDCLKITDLRKIYDNGKTAVNGLNLNLYNQEIFALLGHNGAGKSTTISIMCGLYEPTSGKATYKGLSVFDEGNMDVFRKKLGICPQHDVLFANLTVKEHLDMFCVFKGVPSSERQQEIEKVILDLHLGDKADEMAKNLSGGQKRKLSIAIALIGGSEVVFLDEPSSGMDITSRRNLWEILKKCTGNRIIVLTTHYMEEAAVLGNRIGILNDGRLECSGNGLFLIDRFGKFISLNIYKNAGADDDNIIKWVKEKIPGIKKPEVLSEEILFRIPKDESNDNSQIEVRKGSFSFKNFFMDLEANLEKLGIKSYSASMPTLEDVFIEVTSGKNKHDGKMLASEQSQNSDWMMLKPEQISCFSKFIIDLKCSMKKRFLQIIRDTKTFLLEILCPIILVLIGLGVSSIQFIKDSPKLNVSTDLIQVSQNILMNSKSFYGQSTNILPASVGNNTNVSYKDISALNYISSTLSNFMTNELYNKSDIYGAYYFINNDFSNQNYEFVTFINPQSRNAPIIYTQLLLSNIISQANNGGVKINFSHEPFPITDKLKKQGETRNSSNLVFFVSVAFALIPANFITIIIRERETNTKHLQLISGISLASYWISNFIFELIKYYFIGGVNLLLIYAFGNFPYWLWLIYLLYGLSMIPFTYMLSLFFTHESTAQNVVILINFLFGALGGTVILVLRIFEDLVNIANAIAYILRIIPSFAFAYGFNQLLSSTLLFSVDYPATFFNMIQNNDEYIIKAEYVGSDVLYMAFEFIIYILVLAIVELSRNCCNSKRSQSKLDYKNLDDSLVKAEVEKANLEANKGQYSIQVKNLEKSFSRGCFGKNFMAVDKLSFCLEYGECFALLGVNGAGKTTTFKALTSEHPVTSGDIFIDGMELSSNFQKVRNLIGYCPQFDAIFEYMTVYENLEFYAKVKGIPSDRVDQMIKTLIHELNLSEYEKIVSGTLSGGNKRKLSVGIAMIGNPPIVLLDEPSTGMDPQARRFMWSVIHKISTRSKKSSVILTTHSMEEAETLCRRMGIMVAGQFKCIGSSQAIKNKYGSGFEIDLRVQLMPNEALEKVIHSNNLNPNDLVKDRSGFEQILSKLGKIHYSKQFTETGLAREIISEINSKGQISVRKVIEWTYYNDNVLRCAAKIVNTYEKVSIVEFWDNNFKLKIQKSKNTGNSIGYLFGLLEDMKSDCSLAEYSISQTSLEQIFNYFAAQNQEKVLQLNAAREIQITNDLLAPLI